MKALIEPLKQIIDERGKVMHMLRCDSPLFKQFGEVYFSLVHLGVVKAWKRHLKMTQHFAVPVGQIKLVLYDDRKDSTTSNQLEVHELGESNYSLLVIPPLVWYGFQGISKESALIGNCTDIPHDPDESERLDLKNDVIPYHWEAKICP